ncbi:hypothetical protein [Leptotrichia sp. oral taxon 498]|uniref:hypothetical protein n=1 Tax=Leptotrichia sp. oral taxon 498 TaxID=712368 RepID=UPI0012FDF2E3|nr:hypothetical protein [Leptotrichia sp. oral taxon 498]
MTIDGGAKKKTCKRDWAGVLKGVGQYAGAHYLFGPTNGERPAIAAVRSEAEDYHKSKAIKQISKSWNSCKRH